MNPNSIFYMLDLVYKGNPSSTHSHFSARCFRLQESQTSPNWIFKTKLTNRLGISVLPPLFHEVSTCITPGASHNANYAKNAIPIFDFQYKSVRNPWVFEHTLLNSIINYEDDNLRFILRGGCTGLFACHFFVTAPISFKLGFLTS